MGKLNTFARECGKNESAGIKEIGYMTYTSELATYPMTRAQVVTAASGVPDAGDTKILDEPFDFTGAASGQGYWRSIPLLINRGSVNNLEEGEIGGKTLTNEGLFFIPGNGPVEKEAVECLRGASGCGIWMFPDKAGRYQVVGTIDSPAYFEITEASGTGGEVVGYACRVFADTGFINLEYDATAHGINITPAV